MTNLSLPRQMGAMLWRGGGSRRSRLCRFLVEGPQQPSQVAERDRAGRGVFCPLGCDQLAEEGPHWRALSQAVPGVPRRGESGMGNVDGRSIIVWSPSGFLL